MGMQQLCADAFQEVNEVSVPSAGEWERCGMEAYLCPLCCGSICSVTRMVISSDNPLQCSAEVSYKPSSVHLFSRHQGDQSAVAIADAVCPPPLDPYWRLPGLRPQISTCGGS